MYIYIYRRYTYTHVYVYMYMSFIHTHARILTRALGLTQPTRLRLLFTVRHVAVHSTTCCTGSLCLGWPSGCTSRSPWYRTRWGGETFTTRQSLRQTSTLLPVRHIYIDVCVYAYFMSIYYLSTYLGWGSGLTRTPLSIFLSIDRTDSTPPSTLLPVRHIHINKGVCMHILYIYLHI